MKLSIDAGWLLSALVALAGCSNPPAEGTDQGAGGTTVTPGTGGGGGSVGPGSGGSTSSGGTTATDAGGDAPGASTCPGVLGHPKQDCQYPTYDGFSLKVAEEFDQPIDLVNDAIWTWSDGALSEGAVRMVKEAITFADGKLLLTVSKQAVPTSNSFAEGSKANYPVRLSAMDLASGELRTKYNNFRYGRYEFRMKPPVTGSTDTANPGNFISACFAFRTPKWQDWREIDVEVTPDHPADVGSNVIFANNASAWSADIADFVYTPMAVANNQSDFHTYAFEWLPTGISWFVDGTAVRNVPPFNPRPAGGPQLQIPEKSAKIIMNLWIFGSTGGFGGHYPDNNTYPMHTEIDWFRFYKYNQETTYPCDPVPACLTAEDRDYSKNNPEDGIPATPAGI